MKQFIIALLLATSVQAKHHRHHGHSEDDGLVFVSAESHEGAWLKKRLLQLEQQEQLNIHNKHWNSNVLGFMDENEYTKDFKNSMDTIVFDVEKPKSNS